MALPLTARVVTERVKHGGEFHGKRVIEVESYYVRSERGDRWHACRHASIDSPVHVSGEVAMVWTLPGTPQKTPQDAARRLWKFVREHAATKGVWLVDDGLPRPLRVGVNLMPRERALAIDERLAATRTPTIDAALFVAQHGPLTAGKPRSSITFERPMVEVAGDRRHDASGSGKPPRMRHVGPGDPPLPGAKLRHVGPNRAPSLCPRVRLMLEALGHIVETTRKNEGDPDPEEAVGAIVETLDNHGVTAGDVERAIESETQAPRVHFMLQALLHISRAVRGSGDPVKVLDAVIEALHNHGIAAGDVDKVLR